MNSNLIYSSEIKSYYDPISNRLLKYSVELEHKGLKEQRILTAKDLDILNVKINNCIIKWDKRWAEVSYELKVKQQKQQNLQRAENLTIIAGQEFHEIENILKIRKSMGEEFIWNSLKDFKEFYNGEQKRELELLENKLNDIKPQFPKLHEYPEEPDKNSIRYLPRLTFLEKLIPTKRKKVIQVLGQKFNQDYSNWLINKREIDQINDNLKNKYKLDLSLWNNNLNTQRNELNSAYERRRSEFYKQRIEYNKKIEELKQSYHNLDSDAIYEYCEQILNLSDYPPKFPQSFVLEYWKDSKILIIDYDLPAKEQLPTLKEVKFISTRNELKEVHIPDSQLNKIYNITLFRITLRTLHELFEFDAADALASICFNGWVNSVNPATGHEENRCVLSIQVNKQEVQVIDLARVDPKICFTQLKGIAYHNLHQLTPIKPILQMTKTDKRFIEGYSVANALDDRTNLAAMDWEDFEHLIREIFEKEFSKGGGEVKITRTSRDGGVDAVAFDPDPIRGGKIVIQAKRYTNVVGVSAVRDLYGTVVNEGAIKGILVTTANYGSDAYEFAKDKPITLLNGSNLLHLLEKHGHKAKIDLVEAKKILKDNQ